MALSIATQVRPPPAQGNAMGGGNPLEMMHSMFEIRNMQQQYNANIDAGQRITAAPDLDSAIESLRQSPYAAWQVPTMNQMRQQQLTEAEIRRTGAETFRTQQQTGIDAITSLSRYGPDDPTQFRTMGTNIGNKLPKEVQPAYFDWLDSQVGGNPTPEEFQKRRFAGRIASGIPTEGALGINLGGLPVTETVGGQPTGGLRPLGGGGAIQYPGITPGTGMPVLGQPELGGRGQPGQPSQSGLPGIGKDYLGGPVYTGNEPSPVQLRTNPQTGYPMLSPSQENDAHAASTDFAGPERQSFDDAHNAMAALERMDGAYDNLARGGGFLKPGPSEGFRAEIAGLANTWAEIAGKEAPFNPDQVGSVQDFLKETRRLTGQVTNQFFGSSRHAAQTITEMGQAVPSIDNTILAGKAIIQSLKAAAQWNIDQHNFKNAWLADPKHGNNLIGADEAFNATHDPRRYGERALAEIGMLPGGGFLDKQAVAGAYQKGWLTWDQSAYLLNEEFGVPLPPQLKGKKWTELESK